MENQDKIWLPINSITERMGYVYHNGNRANQRLIVSALVPNPTTWQVSKVENIQPMGLQKLTIYQDKFNPNTDYANLDTGEMYADYYDMQKIDPVSPATSQISTEDSDIASDRLVVNTPTNTLRIGGKYKTITADIFSSINGEEIRVTESYIRRYGNIAWSFNIDNQTFDVDTTVSETRIELDEFNTLLIKVDSYNVIKLKFVIDENSFDKPYLDKELTLQCNLGGLQDKLTLLIIS